MLTARTDNLSRSPGPSWWRKELLGIMLFPLDMCMYITRMHARTHAHTEAHVCTHTCTYTHMGKERRKRYTETHRLTERETYA